jgi:hypothetical protein
VNDVFFWIQRFRHEKNELTDAVKDCLTSGEMAAYEYRKAVDTWSDRTGPSCSDRWKDCKPTDLIACYSKPPQLAIL